MSGHTQDLIIFAIVVGLRLIIPLFVPRFPLPAEIAAMLLDAADQTIYQKWTSLDLTNYQGYDKALDIYYLTILYLATMRNWRHLVAFKVSRFLYFYRLVGAMLFEMTGLRWLLLVFPNTFEYFFIFYEAVRLRWNPLRMSKRLVIGAAAAIWIFIKLPQEYWIHVAELDTTDLMRKYPGWTVVIAVVAVVALYVAYRIVWPKLPPYDWSWRIDADADEPDLTPAQVETARQTMMGRLFNEQLLEKIVMLALVSGIFGQVLPHVDASNLQIAIGVAIVLVINTVVSQFLARRGAGWQSVFTQFAAMAAINAGIAVGFYYLLRSGSGSIHLADTLFFVLLFALIITLYDRYRPFSLARFGEEQSLRKGI
ncbi:MAG TPA: hypothetical protein VH482_23925 [Thermomicrobiales bacterium]